jgi:hypothetical protein
MDYGKSFSYPLEDSDWLRKLGIGALVNFVPILNFATTGYMVQITRNVLNQQPDLLPEWDNFSQKFVDGLMIAVVSFIYSLPFLLLWCVASAFLVLPVLGGESEKATGALAGLSFAAICAVGCFSLLYLLVITLILPAITIFYAREGTFGACFRISEIVSFITTNLSLYLGTVLVLFVGGIILVTVIGILELPLSIIPICGNIIGLLIGLALAFYLQVVAAHMFGQIGREAVVA